MNQPLALKTLKDLIQNTLRPINLWSPEAENLLLATCAQESLFGTFRLQEPSHIAKGIFQEEDFDFKDLFVNFLAYDETLMNWIYSLFESRPPIVDELIHNDPAAVAICRLHYYRAPGALPPVDDLTAVWNYYKTYYNSAGGAATEQEFFDHYRKFVI